jgi:FKBP-type peptidyl-prolyl cis-trans isomerase FkpA
MRYPVQQLDLIMRRFAVILFLLAVPLTAQAADDALSPAANQSFLTANATRPGVVKRPDGLQYRILSSGFGKRPGPTDTIQINFSGKLIDGKIFDGTSPGLPVTLAVNALIRGLNEGVQLMHEGDHWQLVIPSNLGFGPAGAANGVVPPNQALVFDVTLVSVVAAPPPAQASSAFPLGITGSSQGREEQGHAVLTIPQ